jgi:hypothetical protein
MGSETDMLNYTTLGREVNLASRLEGLSGRGRILISDATHKELERTAPELAGISVALPPVTVKGIRERLTAYEVQWRKWGRPAAGGRSPDTQTLKRVASSGQETEGRAGEVAPVEPPTGMRRLE